MNNTILLIVCDFLLLNIIHFTAWDKLEDEPGKTPATGGPVESGSGMGITTLDMESVILKYRNIIADLENEERKNAILQSEMNVTQQQSAEKFKNATDVAIALKDESEKFKKERDKLKNENTNLKQTNFNLSEYNGRLRINLSDAKTDARDALNNAKDARDDAKAEAKAASDARIAQTKAEGVRDQAIDAAKTTRQNAAERIEKAEDRAKTAEQKQEEARIRARVANDKAAEATKNLEVSKTKTEALANTLQIEREQMKIAQDGLVQLRKQIAERIPDLPINANMMATLYFQNQVGLQLKARDRSRKEMTSPTILIEKEELVGEKGRERLKLNVYAITHVKDTPYRLLRNGLAFRESYGSLVPKNSKPLPLNHVRFMKDDPRVIVIPLGTADSPQVKALGVKPYKLAAEPFKFPEAFIMSKNGRKYGEVVFQIDPEHPDYVKLDRSIIKFITGKFNPAQGDLVFSKTGELLGIMVNNRYCLVIQNTTHAEGGFINFGKNDSSNVAQVLGNMKKLIAAKPFALQ